MGSQNLVGCQTDVTPAPLLHLHTKLSMKKCISYLMRLLRGARQTSQADIYIYIFTTWYLKKMLFIYFIFGCVGTWASHCGGFSCYRAQALGHAGSLVVAHRFSCPEACGIFLDQG